MDTRVIDEFLAALGRLIAGYQHRESSADAETGRDVAYGNLRFQFYTDDPNRIDTGIIYETPGGSTNQISVEYRTNDRVYVLPHAHEDGDFASDDLDAVLATVRAHIEQIPMKRMEKLRSYVDSWIEEGRGRLEIFERLNQLLYQDLKGGRITQCELADACRYVVERLSDRGDQ